eukprot:TRINITY_DN5736_c0_g2_i3.p1 TRINITY_DN5736_c0_g2~~TRINITY_DN5736_c0_g2_i3.p1  ORF type:complete len:408 (-),score=74.18 TRINITY_DN5736_c0_g2_i3:116-1339(-)
MTGKLLRKIAHEVIKALSALSILNYSILSLTPDSVFLHKDKRNHIHVVIGDLMLIQQIKNPMPKFSNPIYLNGKCKRDQIDSRCNVYAVGTLLSMLGQKADLVESAKSFKELVRNCFDDEVETALGALLFSEFMHTPGKLSKKYKTIKSVGKGGFGEAFAAERKDKAYGDEEVAIKSQELPLHCSYYLHKTLQLAAAEVIALYGLSSTELGRKHCVILYDHFIDNNILYMVMEYCPQNTLRHRMETPLDFKTIIRIAKEIALGLVAMNSCGIIHRDLKPENIIFKGAKEMRAKLCDFGISKKMSSVNLSEEMSIMIANMRYLPPEAMGGKQTATFDIWSYGVILYEMSFREKPKKVGRAMLREAEIYFPPTADLRMKILIARCLKDEAGERITAAEIVKFIDDNFEA